eukprot:513619_1
MSGQQADAILSGVTSILRKTCRCTWERDRYIADLLKGFKVWRPAKHKHKMPWSIYHTRAMYTHCVSSNELDDLCRGLATDMACTALFRPGELSWRDKDSTLLQINDVYFHPSFEQCTDMIVYLRGRKTATPGMTVPVPVPCICVKPLGGLRGRDICPVERAKQYVIARDKVFRSKPSDPFFMKQNGRRLYYRNLNDWVHECIDRINKATGLTMVVADYTGHTMRLGGSSDRARDGYPIIGLAGYIAFVRIANTCTQFAAFDLFM